MGNYVWIRVPDPICEIKKKNIDTQIIEVDW